MEEALRPLEQAALKLALSADVGWARALRAQIPALRVRLRKQTEVGIWIEFWHVVESEPAVLPGVVIEHPPAVLIRHRDMPDLGDFLVWTKNGLIHALEGTAHGSGRWPISQSVEEFELIPQRTGSPPI